jgi:hypothetical protein
LVSTGNDIAYIAGEHTRMITAEGDTSREIAHFHPAPHSLVWSPDGKRLRFTQMEPPQGTDWMWKISLNRGSPRRVLPEGEHRPHEGSGTWLDG